MYRLAGLALLTSTAAAAPCAIIDNVPIVLTAADTAIADGGGIVVALLPDRSHASKRGALASWRYGDKAKPVIRQVAPGLDVLATSAPATLLDGKEVLVKVKHVAKAADLDAPKVFGIARKEPKNLKHAWTETTAVLDAPPPTGALALIVFDETGKTARSWGRVAGNKTVVVYFSGGCAMLPAGTADSPAGASVRFAWLDSTGRVSKQSAPIAVTEDTTP